MVVKLFPFLESLGLSSALYSENVVQRITADSVCPRVFDVRFQQLALIA
jgi:hypothetical protein